MPIAETHQIQTVFAYKTGDGQKFHDLADAKNHTRKSLLGGQYDKLCKEQPTFAKLDRDLFVEACFKAGTLIGEIMRDPLAPKAPEGLHQGGAPAGQSAPRIIDNVSPQIRPIQQKLDKLAGETAARSRTGAFRPIEADAGESAEMKALRELSDADQAQTIMTNTPRAGEPAGARDRTPAQEVDEEALMRELEEGIESELPTKD